MLTGLLVCCFAVCRLADLLVCVFAGLLVSLFVVLKTAGVQDGWSTGSQVNWFAGTLVCQVPRCWLPHDERRKRYATKTVWLVGGWPVV